MRPRPDGEDEVDEVDEVDEEAEERARARAIRREMRRRRIDDYIQTRDWKRKEEESNPGSRGRFSNW